MKFTTGNIVAIAVGLGALLPQAYEVITNGRAALDACLVAINPVYTSGGLLLSAIIALFSEKLTN